MKNLQIIITHNRGGIDPEKGWATLFASTTIILIWFIISIMIEYKSGRLKEEYCEYSGNFFSACVALCFIAIIWLFTGVTIFFYQFTQNP